MLTQALGQARFAVIAAGTLLTAAAFALLASNPLHHASAPALAPDHHIMHAAMPQSPDAARPSTVVHVVSCHPLPDVPGKAVTTAVVDFPPNAYSPAHRHPGSVSVFVLSGTIRSQLEGGEVETFPAHTSFFEPSGILHVLAENPSPTEPASILATFVTDENCGPLVIPER